MQSKPQDSEVGPARWSTPSIALHWISVVLIVTLVTVGFVMTDLAADSSLRLLLSRLHSFSGITLVIVTVVRLVVRRRSARPAPLPLSPLHRKGAALVQGLLYAAIFALGASGVVTALRTQWPNYVRGELSAAPVLEQVASRQVHEAIVFVLLALIALHVGGVFVHQLRRGGALRRMLPSRAANPASAKT